ncbi:MAG: GldG family protein [Deltaproteobacteria bacterium]|nr:GldG family protein [Deltaproteobacteria bacterium]
MSTSSQTTTEKKTNNTTQTTQQTSGFLSVARFTGAFGIVLLASAPITWFLTGESGVLLWGKIGLGVASLIIYLAVNPRFWRRFFGSRSTPLLLMSSAAIIVALLVVGVINYVAFKNPKQFDFTEEGLYTLSPQTTGVLERLKSTVTIYAFINSNEPNFLSTQDTLRRYQNASDKLTFEMIDPQSRPDLIQQYQITERGPRIVITDGSQEARAKDTSEEELTNAIIKVAEQTAKTIYFLTGHGEPDIDTADAQEGYKGYADALKAEGYGVEKISLLRAREAAKGDKLKAKDLKQAQTTNEENQDILTIPENVPVLVVAATRSPLLPPEIAALEAYLNQGGRMVVLLEPDTDAGLLGLLKQWHIEAHNDIVVDPNPVNRLLGFGAAAPLIQPTQSQETHIIVKDLTAPAVFMTTRSLAVSGDGIEGLQANALLEAGESAWGETKLVGGAAEFDDKDFQAPLSVFITATKTISDSETAKKRSDESHLIVVGDSEWINNKYLNVQGNRDLAINMIHWLAQEQSRIAIRPKSRAASQLFLTGEQMAQIKFFSLDIFPVLVVAFGLGIVLTRRKR